MIRASRVSRDQPFAVLLHQEELVSSCKADMMQFLLGVGWCMKAKGLGGGCSGRLHGFAVARGGSDVLSSEYCRGRGQVPT